MLCLFRNSIIHPKLDPVALALSWAAVVYWLYFAFIEKALWPKMMQGEALIVDLVFGVPIVLAFAVIIYATVYWFFKLILVAFLPAGLVAKASAVDHYEEDSENLPEESQYGQQYWRQTDEEPHEGQTTLTNKKEDSDNKSPHNTNRH